jgi:cyanate lyase
VILQEVTLKRSWCNLSTIALIMLRVCMHAYFRTHQFLFFRVHEAIVHYGEGIKDIINEELGDGM